MSRNGSGTFNLPEGNPVVPGTIIEAEWANTTMSEIAAALTGSIASDGQTKPTNNLPMNSYHHTGVSDATARNQYLTLGYAQDGNVGQVQNIPVTAANNITGTLTGYGNGSPATYAAGSVFGWFQPVTNTGPVTLNVGGVGVKSIVASSESALIAGDLLAGNYYLAYYDGSKFILISETATAAGRTDLQTSVSGWARPTAAGPFPGIIINVDTVSIDIPAGAGVLVPPGQPSGTNPSTRFTWGAQNVPITTMASGWCTHVLMGQSAGVGVIYLQPNSITAAQMRTHVYLCTVEHTNGTSLTNLVQRPAILGDDGYLMRDAVALVANTLVSGGKLTGDVANLTLDISTGTVLLPGASSTSINAPNVLTIASGTNISFIPVRGANTQAAATTAMDTTQYDPNGAGTLGALAGTETAIHRLYYLDGKYFMVYGQQKYATYAIGVASYMLDASNFQLPSYLSSAVFVSAILFTANMANFSTPNVDFAFFSGSSRQYMFGSANALADAPNDAFTYGRFQNTWVPVSAATTPAFVDSVDIIGAAPTLSLTVDPAGGSSAEIILQQDDGVNPIMRWFAIQGDNPSGNVNLIMYDPLTGSVLSSIAIDGVTGVWDLPALTTVNGVTLGNVAGPATVTADTLAQFDGATGKLLKEGPLLQQAIDDDTAGRVLINGSWGLGTTGDLNLPAGTSAQRNPAVDGSMRYNTDLAQVEWNTGIGYAPLWFMEADGIAGFGMYTAAGQYATSFTVLPGVVNKTLSVGGDFNRGSFLLQKMSKTLTAWSLGSGGGCLPSTPAPVASEWWGVFALWSDNTVVDIGLDDDWEAANIRLDTGYQYYRRIGWVRFGNLATNILGFRSDGDGNTTLNFPLRDSVTLSTTAQAVIGLTPPQVRAKVNVFATAMPTSPAIVSYCRLYTTAQDTVPPSVAPGSGNFDLALRGLVGEPTEASMRVDVEIADNQADNDGIFYMVWSTAALTGTGIAVTMPGWYDDRIAANKDNYP